MPRQSPRRLLDQLDEAKRQFNAGAEHTTQRILAFLGKTTITDPEDLLRFHELLLFITAYPQDQKVRTKAESLLRSFAQRVKRLQEAEYDLTDLETPESSGIDGMWVTDTFTYPIVRWLAQRFPRCIKFDWEWFEGENRIAESWPRFMPLLEEDAFVEANVPYREWLQAAKSGNEVVWLMRRFESLPVTESEKAELYDAQGMYVQWTPPYRATRTGMRLPVRQVFYHRSPLIRRQDVSLAEELSARPPRLSRLDSKRGAEAIDMAREASTIRYRELYGFTHGDANRVLETDLGRGVKLFLIGVPPDKRLPLRAYHAATIFKNGVPVGYFEGLSLFERMEGGFNLYYTFRDGETAWLYARLLSVFHHLLGVTSFAIDPYQIGFENEEGIESGAFWFYRKLGFRPTDRAVTQLVEKEEEKLASRPGYRTRASRLRKLAVSPMILEMDQTQRGDWDRFQVRKIGLAAQRRMATEYGGDAVAFRNAATVAVARHLGIDVTSWRKNQLRILSDFAVTLALVPDLDRWSREEKDGVVRVIKAKAKSDEADYLRTMQRHPRLRNALIKLGS